MYIIHIKTLKKAETAQFSLISSTVNDYISVYITNHFSIPLVIMKTRTISFSNALGSLFATIYVK